jgi:molecular chaperone DnaK (HSP70)
MVRHLINTIDKGHWRNEDASVVFTIDPWISCTDRFAIVQTFQMADVTLLSILEAPIAAAYTYAIQQRERFATSPKVVCLFDLGFNHTWAGLYHFEAGKQPTDPPMVKELGIVWNSSFGAGAMNDALTNLFLQHFETSHHYQLNEIEKERFDR